MDTDIHLVLTLLLLSTAAMLAAACISISRFTRQYRRFEAFWSSPTGAALAASLEAKPAAAPAPRHDRTDQRLEELTRAVRALAERQLAAVPQQNAAPEPAAGSSLPIDSAVRMARHGASVEDLAARCGLNIGEARLMKKFHAARRTTSEAAGT